LQRIYPSDLLGNYYLAPADRFLDDYGVPSARYVDDMYIFVEIVDAADHLLRDLIPFLRSYDLVLNEAKSVIMPKGALITEEPDLEALFAGAVEEISRHVDEADFDVDYGFQSDWDDQEDEAEDRDALELKATNILFDSMSDYPGHEENIERFCLPLFSKANCDYAVEHVLDAFKKRPSMSQIYASYLSNFLADGRIHDFLVSLLKDISLFDWQKTWVLAALSQIKPKDDGPVKAALDLLKDANRHEPLRAVAAIYVGRRPRSAKGINLELWKRIKLHSGGNILFGQGMAQRRAFQCKGQLGWARLLTRAAHNCDGQEMNARSIILVRSGSRPTQSTNVRNGAIQPVAGFTCHSAPSGRSRTPAECN
jgi:hypothetical protein